MSTRAAKTLLLARLGAVAAVAVLAGCGSGGATTSSPPATTSGPSTVAMPPGVSEIARVTGHSVGIYASEGDARPALVLSNPNRYNFRRVFLVKKDTPTWLEVYLPLRPDGRTGWVNRSEVSVVRDQYRLRIDLTHHRLTLLRSDAAVHQVTIGVGRAVTPTPSGVYFLTELFRLKNPGGPYGPYGFGLSAYSNVLHEFAGADGQIGIHGTNDPSGLGANVSHGCIRLANDEITRLALLLPLGTPVEIVRA